MGHGDRLDGDVLKAEAAHGVGGPGDGALEGLGAGDALADVVAEVGEVAVALVVGERGGDELVGGGLVGGGEVGLGRSLGCLGGGGRGDEQQGEGEAGRLGQAAGSG